MCSECWSHCLFGWPKKFAPSKIFCFSNLLSFYLTFCQYARSNLYLLYTMDPLSLLRIQQNDNWISCVGKDSFCVSLLFQLQHQLYVSSKWCWLDKKCRCMSHPKVTTSLWWKAWWSVRQLFSHLVARVLLGCSKCSVFGIWCYLILDVLDEHQLFFCSVTHGNQNDR